MPTYVFVHETVVPLQNPGGGEVRLVPRVPGAGAGRAEGGLQPHRHPHAPAQGQQVHKVPPEAEILNNF